MSLAQRFAGLGVRAGSTLLVHCGFRDLGRDGYTPERVIEALLEALGDGTLLMPTMSWRTVSPTQPVFDQATTPSITGILSETFRIRYAVCRSLHPTHSVAGTGPEADALLSGHPLDDTPCSARSPFGRLAAREDGWVMLMGTGMESCTLVHHAEEVVAPDLYLRPSEEVEYYLCRDFSGLEHPVRLRRHLRLRRNFWQFQDLLAERDQLMVGVVGNVVLRLFRATDLHAVVMEGLERDPACILVHPFQRYRWM